MAAAAKWPWEKPCGYTRAELTGPAAPNLLKGGLCNECGWKPLNHGARAMLALACFVCVFCVSLARCPVVPDNFRLRVRSRFNAPSSGDGAFNWLRCTDVCPCVGAPRSRSHAGGAFLGVRCALPVSLRTLGTFVRLVTLSAFAWRGMFSGCSRRELPAVLVLLVGLNGSPWLLVSVLAPPCAARGGVWRRRACSLFLHTAHVLRACRCSWCLAFAAATLFLPRSPRRLWVRARVLHRALCVLTVRAACACSDVLRSSCSLPKRCTLPLACCGASSLCVCLARLPLAARGCAFVFGSVSLSLPSGAPSLHTRGVPAGVLGLLVVLVVLGAPG